MKPQARKNSALDDPRKHAGMKPEVVTPRAIRGDYRLSFGPYVSSSGTVPDIKRRSCRQGRRRSRGGHLAEPGHAAQVLLFSLPCYASRIFTGYHH